MAKGETLQQAMVTFHNAGYPEKDIKGAARAIQVDNATQGTKPVEASPQAPSKVEKKVDTPKKIGVKQEVSSYEEPKEKKGFFKSKWFVAILVILLLFMIGLLVGFFLFQDFFTKLFVQ